MTYVKASAATERASCEDRCWFRQHPQRSHRVREFIPGETPTEQHPPHGMRVMVVVRQVEPGCRVRLFGFVDREVPIEEVGESIAAAVFDLLMALRDVPGKPGIRRIPLQQVLARAATYAKGGSRAH